MRIKALLAGVLLSSQVLAVELFPIDAVRLEDSPFLHAQQTNIQYLLALDPDRLLAPYRREAGVNNNVNSYGNWENTGLDGHIGGHYVSALSAAWAASGDARIKQRLDSYLDALNEIQLANGNGYLGGVPQSKQIWQDVHDGKIEAESFGLNQRWVPLYNIHKMFAGLRDAYTLAHSELAKTMLLKFGVWFSWLVENLTDEQIQTMLRSEHGSINDVLIDVANISGDQDFIELAKKFSHRFILEPLLAEKDRLDGLHANTQIPKVMGFMRIANATEDNNWQRAADFFWRNVSAERSVSIGGNSVREHFHDKLDFTAMVTSNEGPETCNTYNMLKLSEQLYLASNDNAYLEYIERATFNHILSTQHPDHGGLVYFTPMMPGHYRKYSSAQDSMWCCVGSGIENHSLYGKMIYAHQGNELKVNLFIPSTLDWQQQGINIQQLNRLPDDDELEFNVLQSPDAEWVLSIRQPSWLVDQQVTLKLNGRIINPALTNGYWKIQRKWSANDRLNISYSITPRIEMMPDKSNYFSVLYGPWVMAAPIKLPGDESLAFIADDSRMGHIASGAQCPIEKIPMLVGEPETFLAGLKRSGKDVIECRATQAINSVDGKIKTIDSLVPFYRVHDSRYSIYLPQYSPAGFKNYIADLSEQERQKQEYLARIIDQINPGEQQPEVEHDFTSGQSNSGWNAGKHWRDSTEWFEYRLRDIDREAKFLRITYFVGDRGRQFSIKLNGQTLANVSLPVKDINNGDAFYFIDYPITEAIGQALKDGYHQLRFEAAPKSVAGGIYGIELLR